MDALAALGQVLGHARVFGGRGNQLDQAVAGRQEGDLDLLLSHHLARADGQPQQLVVCLQRQIQVVDDDGDVSNRFNYFVEAEFQPKSETPSETETTKEDGASKPTVDMSGTRLTDEAKEELADLVTRSAAVDNQASIRAYKKVASELGREVSVPWDKEAPGTPEGDETYKYISSAKNFEKDVPENDEEKELLRITMKTLKKWKKSYLATNSIKIWLMP